MSNNNWNENNQNNNGATDSTYSYSYLNKEQKDPNNTWREEPHNWNTTGQAREVNKDDWRAQNNQQDGYAGNSQYSHFYTNPDAEPKKQKKQRKHRAGNSGNGGQKGGFGRLVGKVVVCAVIFGLVAGGIMTGMNVLTQKDNSTEATASVSSDDGTQDDIVLNTGNKVSTTDTNATATATDVSQIVENAMPSIVAITNMSETQYRDWFVQSQTYESESCGSGVIISQDDDNLYIATNNHVVEGATTITVSFIDDSTATAEVKGTDSSCDLAVVAIPLDSLTQDTLSAIKVATLGSSDDLSVGEGAIAIGNALGYGQSVTTGVISALDREVTLTDDTTGQSITNDLIQTDAAINPGNSGGALLNMNGEVIGINSAKFASDEVEGMGFAIPISTAQPILSDLITREVVDEADSAYLGISGVDVDETVASTYNMPEGIYVAQVVEGSAAETAGLMKGDIITSFDGKTINSMEYLQEQMQYYSAGTQVEIVIQRANNGQYVEQTLNVTLGSKK